jgi:hypothetical protein
MLSVHTTGTADQGVSKRLKQSGRPQNETTIEIHKPEKSLQLLDCGWTRISLQGLYMTVQRPDTRRR